MWYSPKGAFFLAALWWVSSLAKAEEVCTTRVHASISVTGPALLQIARSQDTLANDQALKARRDEVVSQMAAVSSNNKKLFEMAGYALSGYHGTPDCVPDDTAKENRRLGVLALHASWSKHSQMDLPPLNFLDFLQANAGDVGAIAALDGAGFKLVTRLCCPSEMETFFNRLLESLTYNVCSKPHVQGLMHWFSCVPDMDFQYVLSIIADGNPCKYWAPFGQSCPVLSDACSGHFCAAPATDVGDATEAPIAVPTAVPIAAPTDAPTDTPTDAPTDTSTDAPTTASATTPAAATTGVPTTVAATTAVTTVPATSTLLPTTISIVATTTMTQAVTTTAAATTTGAETTTDVPTTTEEPTTQDPVAIEGFCAQFSGDFEEALLQIGDKCSDFENPGTEVMETNHIVWPKKQVKWSGDRRRQYTAPFDVDQDADGQDLPPMTVPECAAAVSQDADCISAYFDYYDMTGRNTPRGVVCSCHTHIVPPTSFHRRRRRQSINWGGSPPVPACYHRPKGTTPTAWAEHATYKCVAP